MVDGQELPLFVRKSGRVQIGWVVVVDVSVCRKVDGKYSEGEENDNSRDGGISNTYNAQNVPF